MEQIPDGDRETLHHALGTKLFGSPAEGHLSPIHRNIAEFLGGRYLARLVAGGLRVERILALMTGYDGVVVSEMRGLSAWLAAHSRLGRTEIIKRDPLGTVLYGDIRDFSVDEKDLVLDCLEQQTKKTPWYRDIFQLDSRSGDLATSHMKASIPSSIITTTKVASRTGSLRRYWQTCVVERCRTRTTIYRGAC